MAPLEKIEEGIKAGDWSLVIEGYRELTGKKMKGVEAPPSVAITIDLAPIAEEMDRLAESIRKAMGGGIEVTQTPFKEPHKKGRRQAPAKSTKASSKKEKVMVPASTNRFVDDLEHATELIEVDRKSVPQKPSSRRESPQYVKATCAGCGRTDELPPGLAPAPAEGSESDTSFSYFCNACTVGGRGRG